MKHFMPSMSALTPFLVGKPRIRCSRQQQEPDVSPEQEVQKAESTEQKKKKPASGRL